MLRFKVINHENSKVNKSQDVNVTVIYNSFKGILYSAHLSTFGVCLDTKQLPRPLPWDICNFSNVSRQINAELKLPERNEGKHEKIVTNK